MGEPLSSLTYAFPHDWSADGRTVLGTVYRAETSSYDIWSTLVGTGAVSFVLQSSSAELDPQLSRDQRWLAYASNESGRFEVYVRPFVGAGPVTRISRNGGRKPRWSDDGREIFYVQGDGSLMQAALNPGVPQVQALRLLFRHQSLSYTDETGSPAQREDAPEYSVAPDGKRLLIGVLVESPTHSPITVVSNWPALVVR